MSVPVLILTALLTASAGPAEESAKKVKELQKERIATLREVVVIGMKLYQNARVDVSAPLEDRLTLLRAELDMAETDADRVALYTAARDALAQHLDVAKARFEAGRESQYAVLKIRTRLQEIEIQMEQAKMKQAGGGK